MEDLNFSSNANVVLRKRYLKKNNQGEIIETPGELLERVEGYKTALEKSGIALTKGYIKATNFSRKEARSRLDELFSLKNPPTAVFCCSDEIASEVLNFAEEKRMEVPKDLSIIGFDDNPHCLYGNLMLTTVRQPLKEMVHQAVSILKENIENKKPARKIVLDTELIIRDTVSFL